MNTIFTFTIPSSKKETKRSLNDIIFEHVSKITPCLKKETPKYKLSFSTGTVALTPSCPFMSSCKLYTPKYTIKTIKPVDLDTVNLYYEFYEAFNKMKETTEKDNYDFTLFGEPVKFYGDFVQVGYKLIPYTKKSYFDNLSSKEAEELLEILNFITA